MRFVTGGGLRIDYLITHDGQAHSGLMGGNALYAAAGASVWIDETSLWARVGQSYPQEWLERLRAKGLNVEGVVRVAGEQDHRTFYAYTADGQRDDTNPAAHYTRIGQAMPVALAGYVHSTAGDEDPNTFWPLSLRPGDWPQAWRNEPVAVHLSPMNLSTHLHVPAHLRRCGVRQITLDPGERYMRPERLPSIRQLLPLVDAFLPSDKEIESLFGEGKDPWEAAETYCDWGAPLVIVKRGAAGVLVLEGAGGQRTQLAAYHRPGDGRVVDVTGAGDGFCGGFMVGLAHTGDPVAAARYGLVSASFVVEGYGALHALQNHRLELSRLASLEERDG